jgi:peroxiredoxin
LSDPDGGLLDLRGIRHVGAQEGRDLAYPTQVLVDGDGLVRWIYTTDNFRRRADPDEVFRAVDALDRSLPQER